MTANPIQIVIIIALTFFAAVLLSVTMSTHQRLASGYHNYVGKYQKFTYFYKYQVGKQSSSQASSKISFKAFLDLASEYNINPINPKSPKYDFNLYFSTDQGHYNSSAFTDLFDNESYFHSLFLQSNISHWKSLALITIDAQTKIAHYNLSNFTFLPAKNSFIQDTFIKRFNSALVNGNNSSAALQIRESLIGQYYFYLQRHHQLNLKFNTPFLQLPPLVQSYITGYILEGLESWLSQQVVNYFSSYITWAINQYNNNRTGSETTAQTLDKINNYINNPPPTAPYTSPGDFNVYNVPPGSGTSFENLVHQFLFGFAQSDGSQHFSQKNFIGYYGWDHGHTSYQYADPTKGLTTEGLRGMINPVFFNPITKASFFADNWQNMSYSSPYLDFDQVFSNIKETSYTLHQKMAATVSGFNFNVNSELFEFDNINQLQYRIIFVPESSSAKSFSVVHLHMIKGFLPRARDEIVISPQFARANGLHIGSIVPIGLGNFIVSGEGIDPYNFIPRTNDSSLLPNVNKAAVIYCLMSARSFLASYRQSFLSYEYTYLTANQPSSSLNLYGAWLMNNDSSAFQAISFQRHQPGVQYHFSQDNAFPVQTFKQAPGHFNWTLLPKSYFIFTVVCYVVVAILFAITLFACFVQVRTKIKQDTSQIAIFKALGVSNRMISWSYLTYVFFIVMVAVPFGWMVGIVLQWPVAEVFQTFFALPYNIINLDWRPLLILMATFGVFCVAVTLFATYRTLRLTIPEIIHPGSEWHSNRLIEKLKYRFFSRTRFNTRFRVSIFSSSFIKFLTFFFVFFVASCLITMSLALPGYLTNISHTFYKDLKYKNSYQYTQMAMNAPFAHNQISQWPGPKKLNQKYVPQGGYDPTGGDHPTGGFENPADYLSSSNGSGVLPNFVKTKTGFCFTPIYLARNDASALVSNRIVSSTADNFYMANGTTFSVGQLESYLNFIYHDGELTSSQRANILTGLQANLGGGLSSLFAQVFSVKTFFDPKLSWQQNLEKEIFELLPPYVAGYFNSSPTWKEQFNFGWSTVGVQPQTDELSTSLPGFLTQVGNSRTQNVTVTGMSPSHQVVNYSPNLDQALFLPSSKIKQISTLEQAVITGSSLRPQKPICDANGQLIYNPANQTLTIPVLLNKQAAAKLGFQPKVLRHQAVTIPDQTLHLQTSYLTYRQANGSQKPIPQHAWVYDDSDYGQVLAPDSGYQNRYEKEKEKGSYYLDPYQLASYDFTYRQEYQKNESGKLTITSGSPAFIDHYQAHGHYQPQMRPYFRYYNMKLYLPQADLNLSEYLSPDHQNSPFFKKGEAYGEDVPYDSLPPSVQKAYSAIHKNHKNEKYFWIRPFALSYDHRFNPQTSSLGLSLWTNKIEDWYYAATKNTGGKQRQANRQLITFATKNKSQSDEIPNLNVVLKVVGESSAYNQPTIYLDQQLVNALVGYANDPVIQYHIAHLVTDTAGQIKPLDQASNLKTFYDSNSFFSTRYPMWFNTKFTSQIIPYDVTTFYSDSLIKKLGGYMPIVEHYFYHHGDMVTKYDLLSIKESLLNRLTKICLSITVVLIAFIITCASLLVLVIGHSFIDRYYRFMLLMKLEGYRFNEILSYTALLFVPGAGLGYCLGSLTTWLIFYSVGQYIFKTLHYAIPLTLTWWAFFTALLVITAIFMLVILLVYLRLKSSSAATYQKVC